MSLAALTGHPRPYGVRAIHTAQMTAVELARVWADHYGYTGRSGGWIYDQRDRPVVQGWRTFARDLQRQGFIKPGVGVDWAWTERVWPSLRPARVEPYLLARAADLLAEPCEIRYVDRDGHEGDLVRTLPGLEPYRSAAAARHVLPGWTVTTVTRLALLIATEE